LVNYEEKLIPLFRMPTGNVHLKKDHAGMELMKFPI